MAKRLISTVKYLVIAWIGLSVGKIIAERFGVSLPWWITDVGFMDLLWGSMGIFILRFLFRKTHINLRWLRWINWGDLLLTILFVLGGTALVFGSGFLIYLSVKTDPIKEAIKEKQRQKNMELCIEAGGIPEFWQGRFTDCQAK